MIPPIAKRLASTSAAALPKGVAARETSRARAHIEKATATMAPSTLTSTNRAYHISARRKNSTTAAQRADIPTSSWARPPKESQDAHDDVVPSYYIERKRMRDQISERKEEEGGLMAELSAGILSEGVAAETKVMPEKIPVEVLEADGVVRHPSGFEPPTPETEFHPIAAKIPTEDDHPLLTTVKQTWEEALAPVEEAVESAAQAASSGGVRGFHTRAVARALRNLAPRPVFTASAAAAIHTDAVRR